MAGKKSEAAKARGDIADLPQQLAALREMTVNELREKFREVYGEPSRSRNKDYLRKKVAWRIQELAEGGLSDRAREKIDQLAAQTPMRWKKRAMAEPQANVPTDPTRDPRLPAPGTVIIRAHQGVEHAVTVLVDAFEYRGERVASLSKIARAITGTNWNGFLFFGLQRRAQGRAGQ